MVDFAVALAGAHSLDDEAKQQARENIGAQKSFPDRPILVHASGQSNMSRYETSAAWTPPENLLLWNYDAMLDDPSTATGTAFEPPSSSHQSISWSFGAELARASPHRTVYVVNSANGGKPINRWLTGAPSPDLYALGKRNVEAALAAIGEPVEMINLWWQGESDVANASYAANFASYQARLAAETWFDPLAPTLIFGLSPYRSGGDGLAARKFNRVLAGIVAEKPETRKYVATDAFDVASGAWDGAVDNLHVSALGHELVGRLAFYTLKNSMGRASLRSVYVDPNSKQLVQPEKFAFSATKVNVSSVGIVTGMVATFDQSGGAFDASTGTFTVPVPGLWMIEVMGSGTVGAVAQVFRNGANAGSGSNLSLPATATTLSLQNSTTLVLAEGDTIQFNHVSGTFAAIRFAGHFVG